MKKPNINLSKDGIKDFFFRHTEKIIFGIACILILMFFWMGFKTPTYDAITPQAMLDKTKQANTYIHDEGHWSTLSEHRPADTEAVDRIRNADPVDPDAYQYRHLYGTAVLTREPRTDPPLLKPHTLQVRHIRAQVALPPREGGDPTAILTIDSLPTSDVLTFPVDQRNEMFVYRPEKNGLSEGARLATVDAVVGMALVDYEKQHELYRETFQYQRGYDPVRDQPEYVFIEVERRTEDGDWAPITAHVYEISGKLAPAAKELGDDEYVSDKIAMPIPPFLGLDYREFSIVDGIPMRDVAADDARTQQQQQRRNRESEDDPRQDDSDPFAPRRPSGDDPGNDDEGESSPAPADMEDEEKAAPVRLIRFYDLEYKEVGETYYYRVRAWVKDPNNPEAVNAELGSAKSDSDGRGKLGLGGGQAADGPPQGGGGNKRDIQKEKLPLSELDLSGTVRARLNTENADIPVDMKEDRDKFKYGRPTEWAESATPVRITKGFETFVAGPVDPPAIVRFDELNSYFARDEPSATVVVNSFQNDLDVFVPAQNDAMRGSLINFDAVTHMLHPITWQIKEIYESVNTRGDKTGRYFRSDAVLLDIIGGERQSFRSRDTFYKPGEILIMDRNGRIMVRNDIEDETSYRHSNFISEDNELALDDARKRRRGDDDDEDDDGGSN